MIYDVLIVGAGVVGGMLARELSRYDLTVCLLEKENDVARGATKANSGIIHGGFDPEPGTLKAKLNKEGVPLLYKAAEELQVPCRNNGSLVCAFGKEEEPALEALYRRGRANGISRLELLSGEDARVLEPRLSKAVTLALHAPEAGIICPYELTIAAVGNAMDNGVEFKRNFRVKEITKSDVFQVHAASGETVEGVWLLNCAGGCADAIARMAGDDSFRIVPKAGEYMLLDKTGGTMVSRTIFQLPSKKGKGVLVTPTVDGNLLIGPTSEPAASSEHKDTTAEGLRQIRQQASKSVPAVDFRQVITSFAGVRASVKDGDFIIRPSEKDGKLIHVAAIDSPGLTCCCSIAAYTLELLQKDGLVLTEKEQWNGEREDPHAFRKLSEEAQDAVIRQDSNYGKIVCRCETVSEGEIRAAIRRNPPAMDLDGVKHRTRAQMGRCQGGFCGPAIMNILAEEWNIPVERITKCGTGSEMLVGKLGEEG